MPDYSLTASADQLAAEATVERVARAMFHSLYPQCDVEELARLWPHHVGRMRQFARAAIEELKESK